MRARSLMVMTAIALTVAGCKSRRTFSSDYARQYSSWTELASTGRVPAPVNPRPTLELSDAEIERGLAAYQAKVERRTAAVVDAQATAAEPNGRYPQTVAAAARKVQSCYQLGARDAAALVIARQPGLAAWDRAGDVVEINATFRRGSPRSTVELSLARKPGVEGTLAIAIPPGTYAAPLVGVGASGGDERPWTTPDQNRRFRNWPPAQDLAFLRAPVVVLPKGHDRVVAQVPVACASFRIGAPLDGQPMFLDRFQPGSKVDRLMVALCAGPPSPSAETQLAVWLARDDLAWKEFVSKGGAFGSLITFDSRRVLPRHGQGASRLLLEAGIDPRGGRFFEVATPAPAASPERTQPRDDDGVWPDLDRTDPTPLTPAPRQPATTAS